MSYINQPDFIDGVSIQYGMIRFDSYLEYKIKAVEARDYLKKLDVTPETEQACKRAVAAARKITEQLNEAKIRAKRDVLKPYMEFEDQVKEIIGIITEGEDVARDKLRAIDLMHRDEKKAEIRKIWDARIGSFDCGKYLTFEHFLQERHLNKTVPINEVERDMVRFLVDKSDDIRYLSQKPLKDEYIAEYKNCLSLSKAITTVDNRHEEAKAVSDESYMVVRITGKADVILAKQILKDINYKIMEEK